MFSQHLCESWLRPCQVAHSRKPLSSRKQMNERVLRAQQTRDKLLSRRRRADFVPLQVAQMRNFTAPLWRHQPSWTYANATGTAQCKPVTTACSTQAPETHHLFDRNQKANKCQSAITSFPQYARSYFGGSSSHELVPTDTFKK